MSGSRLLPPVLGGLALLAFAPSARGEVLGAASPSPELVTVLFPNAQPSSPPPTARPPAEPPPADKPAAPRVRGERARLALGPALVGSGLGATPAAELVLDAPVRPGLQFRTWLDIPLGSTSLSADGGTSSASLWFGGVGLVGRLTDPGAPFAVLLHGGAGGVLLHTRAVETTSPSRLRVQADGEDVLTLFAQGGVELRRSLTSSIAVVGGVRGGASASRLVVTHARSSGGDAGAFGPLFGALDLKLEVKL